MDSYSGSATPSKINCRDWRNLMPWRRSLSTRDKSKVVGSFQSTMGLNSRSIPCRPEPQPNQHLSSRTLRTDSGVNSVRDLSQTEPSPKLLRGFEKERSL